MTAPRLVAALALTLALSGCTLTPAGATSPDPSQPVVSVGAQGERSWCDQWGNRVYEGRGTGRFAVVGHDWTCPQPEARRPPPIGSTR